MCARGGLSKIIANFQAFDSKTDFYPKVEKENVAALLAFAAGVSVLTTNMFNGTRLVSTPGLIFLYTSTTFMVQSNDMFVVFLVASIKSRLRRFNSLVESMGRTTSVKEDEVVKTGKCK